MIYWICSVTSGRKKSGQNPHSKISQWQSVYMRIISTVELLKQRGNKKVAERRMFTKKVTDDDNFMALSASAQALYLHLSMSADDDGFCNQVSLSMFKAHASVQDLQSLLERRYIYQFDNGVIVIKHWRMANALRKDRYTPTAFQEELKNLHIKDNGAYSWLPNGCQLVAAGKDSIDKDSIDIYMSENSDESEKNTSKNDELKTNFDIIYKSYPKKVGKTKGFEYYKAWVTGGRVISGVRHKLTNKQIWNAISKYKHELEEKNTDLEFYKNFDTFMCKAILDYVEEE
jgi:hypothetical protein